MRSGAEVHSFSRGSDAACKPSRPLVPGVQVEIKAMEPSARRGRYFARRKGCPHRLHVASKSARATRTGPKSKAAFNEEFKRLERALEARRPAQSRPEPLLSVEERAGTRSTHHA